jgi:hypothetical protein
MQDPKNCDKRSRQQTLAEIIHVHMILDVHLVIEFLHQLLHMYALITYIQAQTS